MSNYSFAIAIKAKEIHNNGNGTYSIWMEGQPLKDSDREVLERLYPNLQEQAQKLLNREALIASIATEAEQMKEPTEGSRPGNVEVTPVTRLAGKMNR